MKKVFALLVCSLLALSMLISCAQAESQVVYVYNWEDYICTDVLDIFKEETGIEVKYMRFTTNEDMMLMLEANPGAYDVVFPSDYCVERLLGKGMLSEINYDNIPNYKYILESLQNPDYDPENKYTIPYMWGTVGIIYNTKMVDEEITSWSALFDEKYAGQVIMMDSIRDTIGLTLKSMGYSMNSRDPAQVQAAAQKLIAQKEAGIVKMYQLDDTKNKMIAGEAALGVIYSGDAAVAIEANPDLKYVVPDEGSNVWIDPIIIPASAPNKANAEKFIDFLCRPDIAQMNCEEIMYCSPNAGAIELMGEGYTLNPSDETVANCEFFHDLGDFITIYDALWGQVKNAKVK